MKKLWNFIKKLFGLKSKMTTTTTTRWIVYPQPTPPVLDKVYPHNVNGTEMDLTKICNTNVVTIYSDCENLGMGCYVCADPEANDFTTLAGQYFHDYSNDIVYYIQEVDGMILNVGSCNL